MPSRWLAKTYTTLPLLTRLSPSFVRAVPRNPPPSISYMTGSFSPGLAPADLELQIEAVSLVPAARGDPGGNPGLGHSGAAVVACRTVVQARAARGTSSAGRRPAAPRRDVEIEVILWAVRPQTGPPLVSTVVAAVDEGRRRVREAEVPLTRRPSAPATRPAAAAMNALSGTLPLICYIIVLILFHVIVNTPETAVGLRSPLGWLPVPVTAGPARRSAAAGRHLLAAEEAVVLAAFRGAASIRPQDAGFLPGPSPSAGLCPSLVQGAPGVRTGPPARG